jgi:hypothetical protein
MQILEPIYSTCTWVGRNLGVCSILSVRRITNSWICNGAFSPIPPPLPYESPERRRVRMTSGASGSYSSDDFVLHYDGHGDLSCHSFSGEEEK